MEFETLLNGAINGDDSCYTIIYDKHYHTLFSVCVRYTKSKSETEDYIQDIFTKIFNKLNIFNGDNHRMFGGWIKKIALNYCIDQSRKVKPLFCDNVIIDNIQSYDDYDIVNEHSMNDVIIAAKELSPRYKTVFNLYYVDGYSHNKIDEELGLKSGTSKANLYKAKNKLKTILNK